MAKKKFTAIPKSKAKNAFDLLSEIRKLALDEPKRMAMGCVCFRGESIERAAMKAPACGTVGCVAGWVLTLMGRTDVNHCNSISAHDADAILGLSFLEGTELFYPGKLLWAQNQQTRAHAKAVAAHIAAFQETHAEQLKAKKL